MLVYSRKATVASGAKFADGLGFAVKVTEYMNETQPGVNAKCWMQVGGTFATVHWSLEFADMAAIDGVWAALMADERYQQMVADASDCWLPGSIEDTLLRHIA
jgi:hypothetical protein